MIAAAACAVATALAGAHTARPDASQPSRGRADVVRLSVRASGGVVVASRGAKLRCGGSCTVTLRRGTLIELAALAAERSVFGRWAGACVGTAPRCLLVLDAPVLVTAVFVPRSGGVGADSPAQTTPVGPAGPPGQTTTRASITPPAMAAPPRAQLSVTVSGPGVVRGGGIRCSTSSVRAAGCHGSVARGSSLVLYAQPAPHRHFARWMSGACATRLSCRVRVVSSTLVWAAFRR